MATIKDISEYSYDELKKHLDGLKNATIEATKDALEKARLAVLDLEIKLEGLTGISVNPPKTRGRKKGSKNKVITSKPSKGAKRKKNGPTVKDTILGVLAKAPATSKEVIAETKLNPGSVVQALIALKKAKAIKHDGTRGGKYSLKG